jgi:AcrR family transcriptional regulator
MNTSGTKKKNGTSPGFKRRGIEPIELLEAAAKLFADNGYQATTLEQIAERLNIKKASIYHYIDSKEDLLTGIQRHLLDRYEDQLGPIARSELPADERLRRMIHAYIQLNMANSDMCAVYYTTVTMELRSNKNQAHSGVAEVRKRGRELEKMFESVIVEGQKTGVFRQLTPRLLVLAVLGMCEFVSYWHRFARFTAEQVAGEFALLLESGLRNDEQSFRGAWPRVASIPEALLPVFSQITELQREVSRLSSLLTQAQEQLQQGLLAKIE